MRQTESKDGEHYRNTLHSLHSWTQLSSQKPEVFSEGSTYYLYRYNYATKRKAVNVGYFADAARAARKIREPSLGSQPSKQPSHSHPHLHPKPRQNVSLISKSRLPWLSVRWLRITSMLWRAVEAEARASQEIVSDGYAIPATEIEVLTGGFQISTLSVTILYFMYMKYKSNKL